jgi:hypothetical protein
MLCNPYRNSVITQHIPPRIVEDFGGKLSMSSTTSSLHQRLQQPSSHRLRVGLAISFRRKVYCEDSPAACFSLIFCATFSFSRCISEPDMLLDFFYKQSMRSAVCFWDTSRNFLGQESSYLVGHFLLIGLTSLVSLIASGHLE